MTNFQYYWRKLFWDQMPKQIEKEVDSLSDKWLNAILEKRNMRLHGVALYQYNYALIVNRNRIHKQIESNIQKNIKYSESELSEDMVWYSDELLKSTAMFSVVLEEKGLAKEILNKRGIFV